MCASGEPVQDSIPATPVVPPERLNAPVTRAESGRAYSLEQPLLDWLKVMKFGKDGSKGRTGDRLSIGSVRLQKDGSMRLRLAVLLCSLAVPAFAAPDVNSANFILPHCRAAQQLDKPPGFMAL